MSYRLVFLSGVGERFIVSDILDLGEFRVEGIDGGLGTACGFDVGFFGDKIALFTLDGRGYAKGR